MFTPEQFLESYERMVDRFPEFIAEFDSFDLDLQDEYIEQTRWLVRWGLNEAESGLDQDGLNRLRLARERLKAFQPSLDYFGIDTKP